MKKTCYNCGNYGLFTPTTHYIYKTKVIPQSFMTCLIFNYRHALYVENAEGCGGYVADSINTNKTEVKNEIQPIFTIPWGE